MKNVLSNLTPPSIAKTLALTGFVASVAFVANPAQAASLTYNWSFDGLANTGGTFVADAGVVSSISGTVGGYTISGLLEVDVFAGNDNAIPLTDTGISFIDLNSIAWNLFDAGGGGVSGIFNSDYSTEAQGSFHYQLSATSAASAVPEPLTILGSITAAGFGVAFKRKKNSNKEE